MSIKSRGIESSFITHRVLGNWAVGLLLSTFATKAASKADRWSLSWATQVHGTSSPVLVSTCVCNGSSHRRVPNAGDPGPSAEPALLDELHVFPPKRAQHTFRDHPFWILKKLSRQSSNL